MIDIEVAKSLKKAIVAIGLADAQDRPVNLFGTGFFVNKKGYVMTAKHVMDACDEEIKRIRIVHNIELKVAIFYFVNTGIEIHLKVIHKLQSFAIGVFGNDDSYQGPRDLDVEVIIPKEELTNDQIPFIELRKHPHKLNLLDEVTICGYPNPLQSLNLIKEVGLRLSPCLQFGRITSFLPEDDIPTPWGLQTDIIATGGSSGSPIMDIEGKVVGIAQRVLTASARGNSMKMNFGIVTINEIPFFGTATIGLVYGVTFNVFTDLPEIAMKNHEEGKPISHNPFKVTGLKHMYSTRITSG